MMDKMKSMVTKLALAIAATSIAAASTVRGAFAAGVNLPPEYGEMLRLAEEKVQTATQPGAFGNGVPVMNIDPASALTLIIVGIAVAAGAVVVAKLFVPKVRNDAMTIQ